MTQDEPTTGTGATGSGDTTEAGTTGSDAHDNGAGPGATDTASADAPVGNVAPWA